MREHNKTNSSRSKRDALDKAHDSNVRGEHRYPDGSQSVSERRSRLERDKLKKRLQRGK
jgi:hypothetical protein